MFVETKAERKKPLTDPETGKSAGPLKARRHGDYAAMRLEIDCLARVVQSQRRDIVICTLAFQNDEVAS